MDTGGKQQRRRQQRFEKVRRHARREAVEDEEHEADDEEAARSCDAHTCALIVCCAEDEEEQIPADARFWRNLLLVLTSVAALAVLGVMVLYRPTPILHSGGSVMKPPPPPPLPPPPPSPPSPPPPPPLPPPLPYGAHFVTPLDIEDNTPVDKGPPPGCNCAFAAGTCSADDGTYCWSMCCRR